MWKCLILFLFLCLNHPYDLKSKWFDLIWDPNLKSIVNLDFWKVFPLRFEWNSYGKITVAKTIKYGFFLFSSNFIREVQADESTTCEIKVIESWTMIFSFVQNRFKKSVNLTFTLMVPIERNIERNIITNDWSFGLLLTTSCHGSIVFDLVFLLLCCPMFPQM